MESGLIYAHCGRCKENVLAGQLNEKCKWIRYKGREEKRKRLNKLGKVVCVDVRIRVMSPVRIYSEIGWLRGGEFADIR